MVRPDSKSNLKVLIAGSMALLIFAGCDDNGIFSSDSSDGDRISDGDWLIPSDEIMDGGPGKDGIPSIDDPNYRAAREIDYVDDKRLILGVKMGDDIRAYPHQVMDQHEIVNDQIGGHHICITHCPLTGTGIVWDAELDGSATEFGVSGLLFRNNLIAYDRETDSYWPQMQLRSARGQHQGRDIKTVQVVETTWETWKSLYPNSQVLTTDTGFSRDYSGFAYGQSYLTNDNRILFPITNQDDRLPNKQRVHGIIADRPADDETPVKVYVIEEFSEDIELIADRVGQQDYVIAGSSDYNFVSAFKATLDDGSEPEFEAVSNELPIIMVDNEGNSWDLFGYAVDGPRQGERLTPATSYTGYFFAWADFFPQLDIFEHE